ncbi:sensor histidine kinase [Muricoccus radiodurans]|uniref:sensor histidine kinase n=1 Tax=Muricoccus radiodurans TaxID=2231721 RepID=UPI003CE89853
MRRTLIERLRRPRLRTLLLLSNLVILALPLAGVWFLRLYESALVRQTESELVAQAAVLAGAWRAERGGAGTDGATGLTQRSLDQVRRAGLDLARDPVLPPAPDPRPAPPPVPIAAEVGGRLAPVLRDAQPVTLAAMRLLDPNGVVVATTGGDWGLSLAGLEEVERARQGEPTSVLRWRERRAEWVPGGISRTAGLRVHVALPVMLGGAVDAVVVLSRTPATVTQTIAGKLPEIGAVVLMLLLAVTGLAVAASRLITRPLGAVVAAARRVASGEAATLPPLPVTAVREAAALSKAIARMAATQERRAGYVRGLAAHVSHEFKTPLAGIRGAAELLGDHADSMSAVERARFVQAIEEGADRLDRLVRGLLDLARADMAGPAASGLTALRPLAQAAAGRFPDLRVTVDGAARAAVPEEAAASVLASLLDNTLRHAGPGTDVRIALAEEAGRAVIQVEDEGPGISASNAARIFDPFFTTARGAGGTGLGLAIARSLLEGAGGTIELVPSARGAAFRITLPAEEPQA